MSLHAVAVLAIVMICFIGSFTKHPFWGLVGYIFLYFNIPNPAINWWAVSLPDLRWSFTSAFVVIVSMFIHAGKLNNTKVFSMNNYRFLVALALLMLLITPFATFPEYSYTKFYDFFRYTICFVFFIKCIPNMSKFEILIWVCLICCLNLSWEAYIHPEYRYQGRLEGIGTPDSTDSNLFATVLMMPIPFLINEVLFENKYRKGLALICAAFTLNAIVLCGSRGAIIGLIGTALTFFFCERDKKVRRKIILGVFCAGILFVKLLDPTFIDRLVATKEGGDSTGSGRTEIWAYGLNMARDYPLGAGGYAFEYLSPRYIPENLLTGGRRAPHNTYLLLFVEQGILGLSFFLIFWGMTVKMLHTVRASVMKLEPRAGTELFKIKQYSLATEAAIIGILFSSFFVDRLYFELLYWLAGMATFLYFFGLKLVTQHEQKEAG